jgi:hypothetical protein
MALFKRRRPAEAEETAPVNATGSAQDRNAGEVTGGGAAAGEPSRTELGRNHVDGAEATASDGPYDEADKPDAKGLADFGAIRLPLKPGLKVSAQVAKATGRPLAVIVGLDGSQLELRAFAAPKTLGIWDEGLDDLAQSVTKEGGKAERAQGRFGPELIAEVPTKTAQGRTGKQVVRFIGVDGPRWLLRGAISGKAARDSAAAAPIEDLFAQVVVVRGDNAMAPREPLALRLPGAAEPETAPDNPNALLSRGPEITEVR